MRNKKLNARSRIYKWLYLKDDINLEDAIDIREVKKSLKIANQLLKLKRKQKEQDADRENCKFYSNKFTAQTQFQSQANGCCNQHNKKCKWKVKLK